MWTCEHASRRIPRRHAGLFARARAELDSHRGWDPGALELARLLADRLGGPLLACEWSRLLVDANRSPSNPRIWSRATRSLSRDERDEILERYWRPHRRAVEAAVDEGLARSGRVIHVAVHSFTPVLDGRTRRADVAFLYDSRRPGEVALARRWGSLLRELRGELRVRCNYPYRGDTDGLTTALRRRLPRSRYLGLELELNQALLARPGWRRVGLALAESLARCVAPGATTRSGTRA